jgi:hypothetical protein
MLVADQRSQVLNHHFFHVWHRRRSASVRVSTVILLAAAGVFCGPIAAAAQVPTLAAKVCEPYLVPAGGLREPDNLTKLYNSGNRDQLQERARAIIAAAKARASADCDRKLLDYKVNYIVVTWIGYDPLKDKPQLMRAIVHQPATAAHMLDLPGIGVEDSNPKLVELFVSRDKGASLVSLYTSTREENPVTSQLPAFVQAVAGPLFGTVAAISRTRAGVMVTQEEVPVAFAVTIQRVGLPFRRASIRLQANARDSVDALKFGTALTTLATAVKFKEAAYSDCARAFADMVADGLKTRGIKALCGEQGADPLACIKAFDAFLNDAYKTSVAACGAVNDDVNAMQNVDQKFRDFITAGSSASADLDVTFHNRPLTHWSFGAGSAVVAKASLTKPRVQLDGSGKLQADPLTRVMTMAFVNWSPAGYDEQADYATPSERWRLFFGAALTPDFGAVGGLNVTIVRGIGITCGAGLLFAKGAEPGEIGSAPASSTDAFRLAVARTVFAGISYNFK